MLNSPPSGTNSRQSSAGEQPPRPVSARHTAERQTEARIIAFIIPTLHDNPTMTTSSDPQSLSGVRVLDLSRVLAGPWCTQTLADLGADVIKVERPGSGDDTRGWGPPFLKDRDGADTAEAAYYLGTNRNKRSITIDIAKPAGQALVRHLA